MNDIVIGTYDDAKALVESYIPLFCQLNDSNTNWCVVGSMAVSFGRSSHMQTNFV